MHTQKELPAQEILRIFASLLPQDINVFLLSICVTLLITVKVTSGPCKSVSIYLLYCLLIF